MASESLRRAQKKYRAKHARLDVLLTNELMEQVKLAAKASGVSVSEFVIRAITSALSEPCVLSANSERESVENQEQV